MLKILSDVKDVLKSKKAEKALLFADKISKKAAVLKAKADAIQSGEKVKSVKKEVIIPSDKAVVKQVINKVFVATSSKSIKDFYDNYNAVYELIEADKKLLKSPELAPTQNDSLRTRTAVLKNQSAVQILDTLNFFNLYKEYKAQQELLAKFPDSFLKSKKEHAKFEEFKADILELKKEVIAVYQRKHIEVVLSDKISSIDQQAKVFANADKLLK
jgi:transcription-repair coupling factor (superfamily II helicase)